MKPVRRGRCIQIKSFTDCFFAGDTVAVASRYGRFCIVCVLKAAVTADQLSSADGTLLNVAVNVVEMPKFCAAVRTVLIRPGKFLLAIPDPFVINSAAIDARPSTAVRSQHFLTTKFASCAAIRNQLIQIVISFHAPIPSFLVVLKGDSHYTKIRWLIQASEIKCNVLVKLPKHDFSTASLERYARTTIYSILYIDSINILW